jgi:hypothetical protein
MLVFMLRNACYFNDTTGEIRDEVWVDGGYQALAQRLGVKNQRLIAHWFPAAIEHARRNGSLTSNSQKEVDRREQIQERMGAFVQRIDYRAGEMAATAGSSRSNGGIRSYQNTNRSFSMWLN